MGENFAEKWTFLCVPATLIWAFSFVGQKQDKNTGHQFLADYPDHSNRSAQEMQELS